MTGDAADGRKPATEATRAANRAAAAGLPADDGGDLDDARRGLVAPLDAPTVAGRGGRVIWDIGRFAAFQAPGTPAPDSVHPSLWRQAVLTSVSGLFRVADRVHQVRGMDLSNIAFIEGARGRIVIDALISIEAARAALDLADRHLGKRPVTGLIVTHCHVDHFGGGAGVMERAEAGAPVVVPQGFMENAVSENLLAGNAMGRRAMYMYGATLPVDALGVVDAGLGKTTSLGTTSLVPPTHVVARTGERIEIDGVVFEFQLTPETEAPAEMNVFVPALRVLHVGDNAVATMHNLYTPRGAQIRDALAWSGYLDEALRRFGDGADAVMAGHHWPRWGRAAIARYLSAQRDLYRWIHDETLRLANHGLTMAEIAEAIRPPADLSGEWFTRDYYGTLKHNARAVYQRYLGYFDGNPASLDALPPEASAPRYVAFMGGAETLLGRARESFARGEYRWVAEVVNHLVFAEPGNAAARDLQADALEQLGYQAESAVWRNFYLTGAQELREGPQPAPPVIPMRMAETLSLPLLFDWLGVALNGPKAAGVAAVIDWRLSDAGGARRMIVGNGVLRQAAVGEGAAADASVAISREDLAGVLSGRAALGETKAVVEGDRGAVERVLGLFDAFARRFPIVLP